MQRCRGANDVAPHHFSRNGAYRGKGTETEAGNMSRVQSQTATVLARGRLQPSLAFHSCLQTFPCFSNSFDQCKEPPWNHKHGTVLCCALQQVWMVVTGLSSCYNSSNWILHICAFYSMFIISLFKTLKSNTAILCLHKFWVIFHSFAFCWKN